MPIGEPTAHEVLRGAKRPLRHCSGQAPQSRNSASQNGEIATLPLVARNDNVTTLNAFAKVTPEAFSYQPSAFSSW
jgi:hypothetical protein